MGLSRPGTIQHALSLPEGSSVCLDAVIVDSVSADSFVVREWWDAGTRISVKLTPPAVLAVRQTVDVEGVTGIGPAILKPRVLGYLDRNGNLLLDPPVVKTPVAPVSWPWKADLTTLSSDRAKAELSQPESLGAMAAEEGTIAWAKTLPVGSPLSTPLSGKVVTAGTGRFSGSIYIEEPDRSAGIRVATTSLRDPGDIVDVSEGTVGELDGERFVAGATVAWKERGTALRPIGLINRNLGGGDVCAGGVIRQKGVTALKTPNERVTSPDLNNIGLLVKTTGRITARIAQGSREYIYIDDGSALREALGKTGVRVEVGHLADGNEIWLPPGDEQYVVVTGISACTLLDSYVVRLLRPRSSDDILFRDLASQSWPMFMHDAHHTGQALIEDRAGAAQGETVTMHQVWTAEVPTVDNRRDRYCWPMGQWPPGENAEPAGHRGAGSNNVDHPIFDSSPVVGIWSGPAGERRQRVFIGGFTGTYSASTGRLHAFELETGQPLWTWPAAGQDPLPGGVASTPALARVEGEMRVFFGCMDGKVYAVSAESAETGSLCWEYDTGHRILASPVLSFNAADYPNGILYIGTERNDLLALDADTGALVFRKDLNVHAQDGITGATSPIVVNRGGYDYVIIASDDGYVYKVSGVGHPDPGGLVHYPAREPDQSDPYGLGYPIESSPSYRDGLVYFGGSGSNRNRLTALDVDDLAEVWLSAYCMQEVRTTPALCAHGIYVGDETGQWLYRFVLESTEYTHYTSMDGHVFASQALTGGLVYAAGDDWGAGLSGWLRAFRLDSFDDGNRLFDEEDMPFNLQGKIGASPAVCYTADGQAWRRWILISSRGPVYDEDEILIRPRSMLYAFSSSQ